MVAFDATVERRGSVMHEVTVCAHTEHLRKGTRGYTTLKNCQIESTSNESVSATVVTHLSDKVIPALLADVPQGIEDFLGH